MHFYSLEERKRQLAATRGGNKQSETPPEHRLMPEEERKRTLDMLRLGKQNNTL